MKEKDMLRQPDHISKTTIPVPSTQCLLVSNYWVMIPITLLVNTQPAPLQWQQFILSATLEIAVWYFYWLSVAPGDNWRIFCTIYFLARCTLSILLALTVFGLHERLKTVTLTFKFSE